MTEKPRLRMKSANSKNRKHVPIVHNINTTILNHNNLKCNDINKNLE